MSIVTITLSGKEFKISCPEQSRNTLIALASKLDIEIKEMAAENPYASLELLLVMMALKHIDQRQSQIEMLGGEALENAKLDFQKQLTTFFSELNSLATKLD